MTKYEWERALRGSLKELPLDEQGKIFEYYDELFEDKIDFGMKEAEIVEKFGSPALVAEKIMSDYGMFLKRSEISERAFICETDKASSKVETLEPTREELAPAEDAEIHADEKETDDKTVLEEEIFAKSEASNEQMPDVKEQKSAAFQSEMSAYELVKNIKMDMVNTSVTIEKGDKFRLNFNEDKNTRYDVQMNGSTLCVKERYKRHFNFFSFNNIAKTLVIQIPQLNDLDVYAVRSDCFVKGLSMSYVTVKTVNGSVKLEDVNAERFSLSSTNGDVSIGSGAVKDMTLSSVSGDIKVKNFKVGGGNIISTSGDINVVRTDFNAKSTLVKSISGDINMNDASFKNMEVKTVSGDVSVALIDFDLGYALKCGSLSGSVSAPYSAGGKKKLTVNSISGDVIVTA